MSAPKLPVILAPRARRDLDNILVYTLQHWGEEQEAIYADRIRRALALIGDNPLVGRSRDDLRVGVRAFPIEQHLIIYEVRQTSVRVARILHRRMNAHRALQGSQ
jgi:toxin ParE1/3/4